MKNINCRLLVVVALMLTWLSAQAAMPQGRILGDEGYILISNFDDVYYRTTFLIDGDLYFQQIVPPAPKRFTSNDGEIKEFPVLIKLPSSLWNEKGKIEVLILRQRFEIESLQGERINSIIINKGKVKIEMISQSKVESILRDHLPISVPE